MPNILGTRLRILREELGLTQENLGNALGISAEFISLLELGERTPSLKTLKSISDFFKKDFSYFLEAEEAPSEKLIKRAGEDKKTKTGLRKFYNTCRKSIELESMLGLRPELAPLYTTASAERLAHEERERLGLGSEPIRDIFNLLERNGLHIIRQSLPEEANISGVFLFFELEQSAFALISTHHRIDHQVFIAAHEYFHYLKDRNTEIIVDNQDVLINEYLPLYHPREKLAFLFALHFLAPKEKIKKIIKGQFPPTRLSFQDVLYLKRYFGVSTMAMLYALNHYGYLSSSQLKEFQNTETLEYEKDVFGTVLYEEIEKKTRVKEVVSDRRKWLILEAYQKKKIDGDEASRLLKLDKERLQKLVKIERD